LSIHIGAAGKGPFKFAIHAGLYMGLLAEIMFSTWHLIPVTLRDRQLIELFVEDQKYLEELQLAKTRILETPSTRSTNGLQGTTSELPNCGRPRWYCPRT